jgi:AcrR family transcriptional regulator
MKRAEKKQDLTTRLLTATRELIAENGLEGLKARDIATRAGAALGGLYTVFADIDEIVTAINLENLERLNNRLTDALARAEMPEDRLPLLVWAYLDYARAEPRFWRAMFEHRLKDDEHFPLRHFVALERLMQHFAAPIAYLHPKDTPEAIKRRARTYFSAFHGVIAMGLDHRFSGQSGDDLDEELIALMTLVLSPRGP